MLTGIIVAGLLWAGCFALLWTQTRFAVRRKPVAPLRPVVLRPIVIPRRYGSHEFSDAEVIERFLAVDWLLSHKDVEPVRRSW